MQPAEDRPYDPDWYFGFLDQANLDLDADPGHARQGELLRELYRRFRRNAEDNDKRLLQGDELDAFLDAVRRLAGRFDPDLLAIRQQGVPENFRRYLLDQCAGADSVRVEMRSLMVSGD